VFEWRYATYYPRSIFWAEEEFCDRIERLTDGRIKLTPFAGGELIPSEELLHAVAAGTVEIGHGYSSYFAELGVANIDCGLPMAWSNGQAASILWDQLGYQALAEESYAEAGVHYLGPTFAAPYHILTTKPVNSLNDLRKMKIRATAGFAKMFDKLGVANVYLPGEELYLNLSTGVIDGVLWGGASDYQMLSLDEVAEYYLISPMNEPNADGMFVNPDAWDKLPDDLKLILETETYYQRWRYWLKTLNDEFSVRQEIFNLTSLPAEDVAEMTEAAMVVWDEEAAKSALNAEAVELLKDLNRTLGRIK